jgi:hypothetical protein
VVKYAVFKKENNMSDNDNDDAKKAFTPKVTPFTSKPPVAPVQTWSHDHDSDVIGLMRTSLEHDHGMSANELPNSDEAVIDAWGKIVTKNGTFASALKDLVGE